MGALFSVFLAADVDALQNVAKSLLAPLMRGEWRQVLADTEFWALARQLLEKRGALMQLVLSVQSLLDNEWQAEVLLAPFLTPAQQTLLRKVVSLHCVNAALRQEAFWRLVLSRERFEQLCLVVESFPQPRQIPGNFLVGSLRNAARLLAEFPLFLQRLFALEGISEVLASIGDDKDPWRSGVNAVLDDVILLHRHLQHKELLILGNPIGLLLRALSELARCDHWREILCDARFRENFFCTAVLLDTSRELTLAARQCASVLELRSTQEQLHRGVRLAADVLRLLSTDARVGVACVLLQEYPCAWACLLRVIASTLELLVDAADLEGDAPIALRVLAATMSAMQRLSECPRDTWHADSPVVWSLFLTQDFVRHVYAALDALVATPAPEFAVRDFLRRLQAPSFAKLRQFATLNGPALSATLLEVIRDLAPKGANARLLHSLDREIGRAERSGENRRRKNERGGDVTERDLQLDLFDFVSYLLLFAEYSPLPVPQILVTIMALCGTWLAVLAQCRHALTRLTEHEHFQLVRQLQWLSDFALQRDRCAALLALHRAVTVRADAGETGDALDAKLDRAVALSDAFARLSLLLKGQGDSEELRGDVVAVFLASFLRQALASSSSKSSEMDEMLMRTILRFLRLFSSSTMGATPHVRILSRRLIPILARRVLPLAQRKEAVPVSLGVARLLLRHAFSRRLLGRRQLWHCVSDLSLWEGLLTVPTRGTGVRRTLMYLRVLASNTAFRSLVESLQSDASAKALFSQLCADLCQSVWTHLSLKPTRDAQEERLLRLLAPSSDFRRTATSRVMWQQVFDASTLDVLAGGSLLRGNTWSLLTRVKKPRLRSIRTLLDVLLSLQALFQQQAAL